MLNNATTKQPEHKYLIYITDTDTGQFFAVENVNGHPEFKGTLPIEQAQYIQQTGHTVNTFQYVMSQPVAGSVFITYCLAFMLGIAFEYGATRLRKEFPVKS